MPKAEQPEAWERELEENFFPMNDFTKRRWYIDIQDDEVEYMFQEVKSFIQKTIDSEVEAERNRIDEAIRELSWLQNNSAVKELEENTMYLEAAQVISILHNKQ